MSSASGQQGLELALLGSLRALPIPPDAKGLVWNALNVQVIGTGVTAVAHSSSWASAFWRGTLKVLLTSKAAVAVPVVIAALGAGALQHQKSAAEQRPSAEHAPSKQAAAGSVPSPNASDSNAADTTDSESADAPELVVSEAPNRTPPLLPAKDRLREESALLEQARALLRGGHARAAQATLVRLQAKFPKGALTQEREVLLIETLAARGKSEPAARDARSFIAAHPESPHAIQLRRFIDRPN